MVDMSLGFRREEHRVEGKSGQRHLELGAGPWLGYRQDQTCNTLLTCVMSGSVPGVFLALSYRVEEGRWEAKELGFLRQFLHWASFPLPRPPPHPSVFSTVHN